MHLGWSHVVNFQKTPENLDRSPHIPIQNHLGCGIWKFDFDPSQHFCFGLNSNFVWQRKHTRYLIIDITYITQYTRAVYIPVNVTLK